jgi:multiple sugar transport system permease protein
MTAAAPPAPPPGAGAGQGDVRRRIGEKWYTPYLFILPHLAVFLAFVGWPFIYGIWISLQRYNLGGAPPSFVGFENYRAIFDPSHFQFAPFWRSVWNTIIFVIISTPTLVGAGLALAALLNQRFRFRNAFRAVFFAPWTLSVAVVGLLWWWMLNAQAGMVNIVLNAVGVGAVPWLTSNPPAWIAILIATLWWTIGFNTIILLAGMQSISADLYEAAAIDGASKWQAFRHITIPSLRPILLLVITLQIIASFNLLGQPQIMTGGGPAPGQTLPALYHVYNTGFTGRFDLGLAAAMALVVAGLITIVSIINFRYFSSDRA